MNRSSSMMNGDQLPRTHSPVAGLRKDPNVNTAELTGFVRSSTVNPTRTYIKITLDHVANIRGNT